MRVGILMGRGVEGCGVTKCVIEFCKVHPSPVYATSDKKWPRKKAHGDLGFVEFQAADWSQCEKVATDLNELDAVIVYSLPSKDSHPEDCQINFLRMLESITTRKVMVHLDHSVKSLHNNANLVRVLESMDLVLTHSERGVLAKFASKNGVSTPVKQVGLGFDFDAHRASYWKPVSEQDPLTLRWIGRTARWKGPRLVLDFHDEQLRRRGFRTVLEGLEASINYVIVLYYDDHGKSQPRDVNCMFRTWEKSKKPINIDHGNEVHGDAAYLYPPYDNAECMERLSRSAFGSDLYHLGVDQYGASIENCHGEIVASGCVPVFHKHFGDSIIHRVTGDPVSFSSLSGTVFLDENNFVEVGERMEKLSRDPVLRDETREMAFEFWRSHANAPTVVDDIMKLVSDSAAPVGLEGFFS